ncbi:MAG: hypothetical protein ABRQ39_17710 [Candidatus Eremiobacterota bacterium]
MKKYFYDDKSSPAAGGTAKKVDLQKTAVMMIEFLKNSDKAERRKFVDIIRNDLTFDRLVELARYAISKM